MRIAIDASPLLAPNPTGVGRVVRELIRAIAERESEHEILAVAPDRAPRLVIPATAKTRVVPVALEGAGRRWRGRPAERFCRERAVDVFYSPISAFPLRAGCPTVATVQETPWETPGTRGDEGTGFNHRLWATLDAWYASRVVCPTQASADDFLRSHLRRSSQKKVSVIPYGVADVFSPKADKAAAASVERFKFRPDYPFFLVVTAPRRVKNFDLAFRALRIFRDRTKVDGRIFVVGPEGEELNRALGYADGLGLRSYITPFGFVPDSDLAELYRRARATLVLSRAEGFGFPVVESMACGTPVIHSGIPALAEVAGSAGIEVSLDDEEAVGRAMAQIHADTALRERKAADGIARAAEFRWSKTADRLIALFEELGGGGAGHGAHAHAHAGAAH